MTHPTPRQLYIAARTLDQMPGALARLAERETRATARLDAVLGREPVTVPGYRVWRDRDGLHVQPLPATLPDGWAQLSADLD